MFTRHGFGEGFPGGYPGGMPGNYAGGYGPYAQFYPWMHLAGMALFLLVVLVVALVLWRRYKHHLHAQPLPQTATAEATSPALEILKMRLVKGEISSEDYQRIKTDLLG